MIITLYSLENKLFVYYKGSPLAGRHDAMKAGAERSSWFYTLYREVITPCAGLARDPLGLMNPKHPDIDARNSLAYNTPWFKMKFT